LTYHSQDKLHTGTIISVPLITTVKEAVVIEEVEKPDFEAEEIVSVTDKCNSLEQMAMSKFISQY